MKTRKYKHPALQKVYDLFREDATAQRIRSIAANEIYPGTALQSAYQRGVNGIVQKYVQTSLQSAAYAAGVDNRTELWANFV